MEPAVAVNEGAGFEMTQVERGKVEEARGFR